MSADIRDHNIIVVFHEVNGAVESVTTYPKNIPDLYLKLLFENAAIKLNNNIESEELLNHAKKIIETK